MGKNLVYNEVIWRTKWSKGGWKVSDIVKVRLHRGTFFSHVLGLSTYISHLIQFTCLIKLWNREDISRTQKVFFGLMYPSDVFRVSLLVKLKDKKRFYFFKSISISRISWNLFSAVRTLSTASKQRRLCVIKCFLYDGVFIMHDWLISITCSRNQCEETEKSEIKNKFQVSSKKISFRIINCYWARKYIGPSN